MDEFKNAGGQTLRPDNNCLLQEMIAYYRGDAKRIQHFVKVYQFAKMIGELEQLPEEEQFILETAAIVHDIGIKAAEENTAAVQVSCRKGKGRQWQNSF